MKPPPQVTLRSGPAGVSLRVGFDVPPDFMTQLLDRFERAHREGGIDAGLLPDRPLSVAQLRDEWIRAQRTKHVALPLAKKRPLYTPDGDVGWFFDDN